MLNRIVSALLAAALLLACAVPAGAEALAVASPEALEGSRWDFMGAGEALTDFYAASAAAFLTARPGENAVYSPLNVYLALAMLAEITGGETRTQILSRLGVPSVEALREQAYSVFRANYAALSAFTCLPGASLWLDESAQCRPETLQTLADRYFASSFQGKMGSDTLNDAYRAWINQHTGNLLAEQASGEGLPEGALVCLMATLYVRARWDQEFYKKATDEAVFHADSGDLLRPFMHLTDWEGRYAEGGLFTAAYAEFVEGGRMWFLLPHAGIAPEELLKDPQALGFLASGGTALPQRYALIHYSVPRFDITAHLSLNDGLKALGVQRVFQPGIADFSPLTDGSLFLSSVTHNARVAVDEEGVIAAAYTKMLMGDTAPAPMEELDFVLDRPFLFLIAATDNTPLFIGIVHAP